MLKKNNYDKLKEYDYDLYRKTIEFSCGLTENAQLISGNKIDLKTRAYIEKDIIGYTVFLLGIKDC